MRVKKGDRCLLVYEKKYHQIPDILISIQQAFGEPGGPFTLLSAVVCLVSALFENDGHRLGEIDINFFNRRHSGSG